MEIVGYLVSGLIGAVLAAITGQLTWVHQQKTQRMAKRRVLLRALFTELDILRKPPFLDFLPITIHTPALLLDGLTLDYEQDLELVERLLALRTIIDIWNAGLDTHLTHTPAVQGKPDPISSARQAARESNSRKLLAAVGAVIEVLPESSQRGLSWLAKAGTREGTA